MTSSVERDATASAHRQLTGPILLFLAGHQPLAFGVGQILYAVAPLLSLLNIQGITDWAALLSEPGALSQLEQMLMAGKSTSKHPARHMPPATRENHVLE